MSLSRCLNNYSSCLEVLVLPTPRRIAALYKQLNLRSAPGIACLTRKSLVWYAQTFCALQRLVLVWFGILLRFLRFGWRLRSAAGCLLRKHSSRSWASGWKSCWTQRCLVVFLGSVLFLERKPTWGKRGCLEGFVVCCDCLDWHVDCCVVVLSDMDEA